MSRIRLNRSFLLTLALKTKTRVMTLLAPAWLKCSPNLINILVPYRLPIKYWNTGIGTSTIRLPWWEVVPHVKMRSFMIHVPWWCFNLQHLLDSVPCDYTKTNIFICAHVFVLFFPPPFFTWIAWGWDLRIWCEHVINIFSIKMWFSRGILPNATWQQFIRCDLGSLFKWFESLYSE